MRSTIKAEQLLTDRSVETRGLVEEWSQAYRRLAEEGLKGGTDKALTKAQHMAEEMFDRNLIVFSERRFIERYVNEELSFHFHCVGRQIGGREQGFDFCAVVQSALDHGRTTTISCDGTLKSLTATNRDVQVAVFVDVREFGQKFQGSESCRVVVRLQSFDECVGLVGQPRQLTYASEQILWDRRRCDARREPTPNRKLAALLPTGWEDDPDLIPLDQLEYQMVQSGSNLIEHFTAQDPDITRRFLGDVQSFFTVRMSNNLIRFAAAIRGEAVFDRVEMFRCPDEFELGGNETIHEQDSACCKIR